MILIKKEKDNKLYDSTNKKYINLANIIRYVRQGLKIKVIDPNNKDITKNTLLASLFYEKSSINVDEEVLIELIKLPN